MFASSKSFNYWVFGLMAVYSVLCFVVPEVLRGMSKEGVLALVIGVSPAYPLAAVLWLYIKEIARLDEFQQKVQMLSLAIATAVILTGTTAWGFVVLHLEYPAFPSFLLLPVYLLVWAIAGWLVKRRYM